MELDYAEDVIDLNYSFIASLLQVFCDFYLFIFLHRFSLNEFNSIMFKV